MPSELTSHEYQQVMHDVFGEDECYHLKTYFQKDKQIFTTQCYPMCAQFFVHKDSILARPKSFYENCYNLCSSDTYLLSKLASSSHYKNRTITAFLFEANRHYIFGEDYMYALPYYKNYLLNYPFKTHPHDYIRFIRFSFNQIVFHHF